MALLKNAVSSMFEIGNFPTRFMVALVVTVMSFGCTTLPSKDVLARAGLIPIPTVRLDETPAAVRVTIERAAAGRRIEKIHRVQELEGHLYRAYVASTSGPERVTVDYRGKLLDHAVVMAFGDMPDVVQQTAREAVAGEMGLCRKRIHPAEPVYIVDYLINGDEPVFAVIEANGRLLTAIGYAEKD